MNWSIRTWGRESNDVYGVTIGGLYLEVYKCDISYDDLEVYVNKIVDKSNKIGRTIKKPNK